MIAEKVHYVNLFMSVPIVTPFMRGWQSFKPNIDSRLSMAQLDLPDSAIYGIGGVPEINP